MKNKGILVLLIFFLVSMICVKAQDIPVLEHESVFIQQMNTMTTDFNTPTLPGNISEILQVGNFNNASVIQNGRMNYTGVIQYGDFNEADIDLTGNFNYVLIGQFGNNNVVEKTIHDNAQSFQLIQVGDNLNFSVEGNMLPGMRITQQGSGIDMQIR